MTKQETARILKFLKNTYPTVNMKDEQGTLDAWQEILADVEFEAAYEAAKRIVREQETSVFPAVGRIYALAKQIWTERQPKEKPWYMED